MKRKSCENNGKRILFSSTPDNTQNGSNTIAAIATAITIAMVKNVKYNVRALALHNIINITIHFSLLD